MRKIAYDIIKNFFRETHNNFPDEVRGLGYGSDKSQQIRFKVLLEGIDQKTPEDSIIDVGCGYGDLARMIDWTLNYHGIDITPEMIKTAKKRYPGLDFRVANLFDEDGKYDWVIAAGIFNVNTGNNQELIKESIKKMWEICTKGVLFDILIKGSKVKNKKAYFYNPGKVLNFCRTLTHLVICRMDYFPHDAAFYLYRKI